MCQCPKFWIPNVVREDVMNVFTRTAAVLSLVGGLAFGAASAASAAPAALPSQVAAHHHGGGYGWTGGYGHWGGGWADGYDGYGYDGYGDDWYTGYDDDWYDGYAGYGGYGANCAGLAFHHGYWHDSCGDTLTSDPYRHVED
jgi:hypothetical protein